MDGNNKLIGAIIIGVAIAAFYLNRKGIIALASSLSSRGLAFLKKEENTILHVYTDPAGYPTIGTGHRILPGENFPDTITDEQATALLLSDTTKAQNAIRSKVTVPLTQNQFDALTSLVFNIGTTAFANSTLLRLLNGGFYDAAAEQFLVWKYAGGKPILLSRRRREKSLFQTPERVA